jgi:hypothetical protein
MIGTSAIKQRPWDTMGCGEDLENKTQEQLIDNIAAISGMSPWDM